jgi:hypothetical protein
MHLVSTSSGATFTVDPRTCLFHASTQQNAHIEGGTGLFAHASGTFTGTVSPEGLLPRNPDGSCANDEDRCALPRHELPGPATEHESPGSASQTWTRVRSAPGLCPGRLVPAGPHVTGHLVRRQSIAG